MVGQARSPCETKVTTPDLMALIYKLMSADGQVRDMTVEEKVDRYYNDVDATEDAVLFPEEQEGLIVTATGSHAGRITRELEEASSNMRRFVYGLQSDDDSDDYEDLNSRMDVQKKKKQLQLEQKKGKTLVKTKAGTRKQQNAVFHNHKAGHSQTSGSSMIAGLEEARRREYRSDAQVEACPNDDAPDCECIACEEAEFGGGPRTEIVNTGRSNAHRGEEESEWEQDDSEASDDEKREDDITDRDLEAVETDPTQRKKLMHFRILRWSTPRRCRASLCLAR